MKKILLIITILLLAGFALFAYLKRGPNEADYKSTVPPTDLALRVVDTSTIDPPVRTDVSPGGQSTHNRPTIDPQSEINLDVTFFPQAPDADWSLPWKEACEEASSTLAYYYLANKPLSKEKFKEEVLELVTWQKKNYGDYLHTTVDQTAKMIREYFGYNDLEILENPTIDQMKEYLSKGHLIIAPFAGRQLGNPFYSGEGPIYHMLVIKGYDEESFITNDVGTKRGHNFIYPYKTIMSSMHDYDTDISMGEKRVIVMY